ncbi:MAG: metallophosphoesterase [Wenzhouxiangellaceae bacterium]|nr:metallophosphoesterase [Wenzhouxiangellaceae bacterium]
MTPLRLLQVSDCHLSRQPHAAYRGQDADLNLERLSAAVRAWRPDRVILSGDLSEDASVESYQRLAGWAGCFGCPVDWLPGNHDDRQVMDSVFGAAGFGSGPVIDAGNWQFALLDSTWPNDPAGELDAGRLQGLQSLASNRPLGIFVHHQPIPVGAAWIDKVGLRQADRLWSLLDASGTARFVAFGHVHQRFRRKFHGVDCLACPSTAANSLAATERFTPGEETPLARWFVLGKNDFRSGYLAA